MKGDKVPCRNLFSNGTEYEIFLEGQCFKGCSYFRKGRCRIFNAMEIARFDESCFPYDDLLDYEGYGGKECKRYTTEKLRRKRHKRQIEGQTELEVQYEC